jgi:hypothetical protein
MAWTWNLFRDIPQNTYGAAGSPRTITATIPSGMAHPLEAIRLTMTRPTGGFPVGGIYTATLTYPDGSSSGVTFGGGDLLMRDGITPLTQSEAMWTHPAGVFPPGTLSMVFSNDKAVTTAIQLLWGYSS